MLSSGLCLSHWNFFFPLEFPSLARCPQNLQPALTHSWGEKRCHPTMTDYNQCLMAPHSSTLAWKIPWTEEPDRLQSMGSWRLGHLLSDFTFTFHFHALEKEMATHSSVLAWRIPGTGEPGGLPSMGSHRVGHDWSDLAAAAASSRSGHCDYWMVTVPLSVDMPFLESPNSVTIISVDKIQSSARSLKKEWACGPGWARGPQPSSTESCFLIIRVI